MLKFLKPFNHDFVYYIVITLLRTNVLTCSNDGVLKNDLLTRSILRVG